MSVEGIMIFRPQSGLLSMSSSRAPQFSTFAGTPRLLVQLGDARPGHKVGKIDFGKLKQADYPAIGIISLLGDKLESSLIWLAFEPRSCRTPKLHTVALRG